MKKELEGKIKARLSQPAGWCYFFFVLLPRLITGIALPWRRIDVKNVLLQSLAPIPLVIVGFAVGMLVVLRRHLVE